MAEQAECAKTANIDDQTENERPLESRSTTTKSNKSNKSKKSPDKKAKRQKNRGKSEGNPVERSKPNEIQRRKWAVFGPFCRKFDKSFKIKGIGKIGSKGDD